MNSANKVILVVDDSIVILERVIPLLREVPGIDLVIHAGTCKEAQHILDSVQPDLVLLDLHLPDKSGISLLEAIKTRYGQIIVFVMTNHATDQYRETCARLGASAFFDKSDDFEALAEALIV